MGVRETGEEKWIGEGGREKGRVKRGLWVGEGKGRGDKIYGRGRERGENIWGWEEREEKRDRKGKGKGMRERKKVYGKGRAREIGEEMWEGKGIWECRE